MIIIKFLDIELLKSKTEFTKCDINSWVWLFIKFIFIPYFKLDLNCIENGNYLFLFLLFWNYGKLYFLIGASKLKILSFLSV